MKIIPWGWGLVKIEIKITDGSFESFYFRKMDGSVFQPVEEGYKFKNILKNWEQEIEGYHILYDLLLQDYVPESQIHINNFLYCYNNNYYSDNRMKLYVNYENVVGWWAVESYMMQWVVPDEYPEQIDITKATPAGQFLHLKCRTKEMISKADFNYLIYRDVGLNEWGLYDTRQRKSGRPGTGKQKKGLNIFSNMIGITGITRHQGRQRIGVRS